MTLNAQGSRVSHRFDVGFDRYIAGFEPRRLPQYRFDVLVLGGGCAGISAAVAAASSGASVALVCKDEVRESNTVYAQGGIAAVLHPDDTVESHVADTLKVGCGLSDPAAVDQVVRGGPQVIQQLIDWGAQFDLNAEGGIDLSQEGGHSNHRIIHAGGAATGIELQKTLTRAVRQHDGITIFEHTTAIDLLSLPEGRVVGALCYTPSGNQVIFSARQVVLATGGAGQLYRETTNPVIATGDGLAMGFRAGAALRDMEFIQFHPTCLYIAGAARVLISEIVRGAGGLLRDRDGVRFMPEYHERAELAPRDVVSRACFRRMVQTSDTSVYLDLSDLERDPHELFPRISRTCGRFGIDIAKDPVPVRPGAHYMIGGLEVDLGGRTSVAGLWAVGEVASTGLHGANRMGSNSLLEGLTLGARTGELAAREARGGSLLPPESCTPAVLSPRDPELRLGIDDMLYSLKSLMWRQMGIERSADLLEDALEKIGFWTQAVADLAPVEPRSWELLNLLSVAQLSARSALAREESRGVHYRSDYPEPKDKWRAHIRLEPVAEDGRIVAVGLARQPISEAVPLR